MKILQELANQLVRQPPVGDALDSFAWHRRLRELQHLDPDQFEETIANVVRVKEAEQRRAMHTCNTHWQERVEQAVQGWGLASPHACSQQVRRCCRPA